MSAWVAGFIFAVMAASSWLVVRANVPQVASGTWLAAGDVGAIPTGAASVALPDGRVLVAGGQTNGSFSTGISTYDPAAGAWAAAGDLTVARVRSYRDAVEGRPRVDRRGLHGVRSVVRHRNS